MKALLQTEGLTSGYASVPVARDVSIRVGEGELVALLGPNGAGKTATLLAISGLLPVFAGSVAVFGADVGQRRLRPYDLARMGLAHVPEDRSLFGDLTVAEHLRVCPGVGPTEIAEALEHFPALEPLLGSKAAVLSGGEQQMLSLARAFACRPRLLIVDELSLGLAPVIANRLMPELRAFTTKTGAGVLLVEQHAEMALRTADRAYVMVNGELVAEGTAAEISGRRDMLAGSYLGGSPTDRVPARDRNGRQG